MNFATVSGSCGVSAPAVSCVFSRSRLDQSIVIGLGAPNHFSSITPFRRSDASPRGSRSGAGSVPPYFQSCRRLGAEIGVLRYRSKFEGSTTGSTRRPFWESPRMTLLRSRSWSQSFWTGSPQQRRARLGITQLGLQIFRWHQRISLHRCLGRDSSFNVFRRKTWAKWPVVATFSGIRSSFVDGFRHLC